MNIGFEHPHILWFLALLLIPILLHLFNLQLPQVVYFSSNQFLKRIHSETKKASTLKRILLLISRLLALACIIIAFAKPTSNTTNEAVTINDEIAIYIDNSNSMTTQSKHGKSIDYAKSIAIDIVNYSDKSSKFWIADNNRVYAYKTPVNKSKALELISSIQTSSKTKKLSDVIENMQWKSDNKNIKTIVISDCQKSTFNISEISDSTSNIEIIPIKSEENDNIAIDSCWFDYKFHNANTPENLSIRLHNYSNSSKEISIKIFIKDSLKSLSSVEVPEGISTQTIEFSNTNVSFIELKIAIEDYPITFDNEYFISYSLNDTISIKQVFSEEENRAVNAMYASQNRFVYETSNSISFALTELPNYDLTVLHDFNILNSQNKGAYLEYLNKGGNLLLLPTKKPSTETINILKEIGVSVDSVNTRTAQIENISIKEEIFNNAFSKTEINNSLQKVKNNLWGSIIKGRSLINFSNSQPAFIESNYGKGKVYTSLIPFSEENQALISASYIAPLLYNIANYCLPAFVSNATINSEVVVPYKYIDSEVFSIVNSGNTQEYTPQTRQDLFNKRVIILPVKNISDPGFYYLKNTSNRLPLAFNLDKSESNLQTYSINALEELSQKLNLNTSIRTSDISLNSEIIINTENTSPFVYILIILSLLFFIIEMIILKLL